MTSKAETLREAAGVFEKEMGRAWGYDAAWLTSGTKVAELVACVLREMADDDDLLHAEPTYPTDQGQRQDAGAEGEL